MNDDLDDVLSRIALHVESDVAEAEPTMFADAPRRFWCPPGVGSLCAGHHPAAFRQRRGLLGGRIWPDSGPSDASAPDVSGINQK